MMQRLLAVAFVLHTAAATPASAAPAAGYPATNGTGFFLTNAAAKDGAVCLDGTPSAYYLSPGSGSGAQLLIHPPPGRRLVPQRDGLPRHQHGLPEDADRAGDGGPVGRHIARPGSQPADAQVSYCRSCCSWRC